MNNHKKIRVLIVDDSMLYREVLSKGLSLDPDIEVVATAKDPFDARDKITEFEPDVMTCDVQMPKMNGIEFIKRLMPQYPLPIVVVSSANEIVFSAMSAGAVDFVGKPDLKIGKSTEVFIDELINKIKIASLANVLQAKASDANHQLAPGSSTEVKIRIIAIGASTGGTEALSSVLGSLPHAIPGIVIVQHIPPVFSRMFADRLNNSTRLQVKEAETGDYVEEGVVLIAPGDSQMKIKKIASRFRVEVFKGEKVNGHCPSVDVLFESVAKECGSNAIGILLTGMGNDGAKGLLSMRKSGARTIGQDEKSSVVYGMPKAAYDIGAIERQAHIDNIPKILLSLLGN